MEFPKTCYYCNYSPIARYNDVPVCTEHLPEKKQTKAHAYTSPVDEETPPTPRVGSLFGPFGM